jgi:hypothetical protein
MLRPTLALALGLALCGPAAAEGPTAIPDGNWKLTFSQGGNDSTFYIVKTETKEGRVTGTLAATAPNFPPSLLDNVSVTNGQVTVTVKGPATFAFAGRADAKDAKTVLGTMEINGTLYRARMTHTDQTELAQADVTSRPEAPEPMRQAEQLTVRVRQLAMQVLRAQAADEKEKLQKEAKEIEGQQAGFYREVVEKHADSPAAIDAGLALLRSAAKNSVKPDEVEKTATVVVKAAERFGSRYANDVATQVAEVIAGQDGYGPMAVAYARRAEKALAPDASPTQQVRVLKTLKKALEKSADNAEQAKEIDARLVKLEEALDQEYLKTVPPFKPATFEGRKAKSDRVVVMELFTGAQCPPCVAADVAFDGLEKTYKPTDLILIQYHLHIPGPDPLTSPASLARQSYYAVRSTPSTFFNGKLQAAGGGGMDRSEIKYKEYRGLIDPLLDQPAGAKLSGTATRRGDKINVQVEVADLNEPAESTKLRLLLVEEQIRYVGGNRLRFHHQVVRAIPGGPDGYALKDKTTRQSAEIDLGVLRQELTKYLDGYAAERAFPNPDRPLAFKHLKVIALVQNDKTKEILQAAQFDIAGEAASR